MQVLLFIAAGIGRTSEASQFLVVNRLHLNCMPTEGRLPRQFGSCSFAPQHAIRVGDIPTAALAMPLPSCKPSHTGSTPALASAISTAASVGPIPSHCSVHEATLAGGGVTPTAAPHLP